MMLLTKVCILCLQGASAGVVGAGSSWGLYFFLYVRPVQLHVFTKILVILMCSYNAFKFQLQQGDINHQLSATSHLMCATCAGNPYTPFTVSPVIAFTPFLLYRGNHVDPNQSHMGSEDSSLPHKYYQCSQLHALHRPH